MKWWTVILVVFLATKINSQERLFELDSMAFLALEHEKFNDAERLALKSLEISGDSASIFSINAYTLMGILNKNRGFYNVAISNYSVALVQSEELQDTARISACLNNLGIIFKLQGLPSKAKDYFRRSLWLENYLNNELQKSIRLCNLAELYLEEDSIQMAMEFYTASLNIELKHNKHEGVISTQLGIAETFLKENQIKKCDSMISIITPEIAKLTMDLQIAFGILNAKNLLISKNYKKAKESLINYEQLALDYNLSYYQEEIVLLMIEIEKKEAKSNQSALIGLYKKLQGINKRTLQSLNRAQLEEINYMDELHKAKLELSRSNNKRKIAESQMREAEKLRTLETRVLLYVILVIIIVGGVVYYSLSKLTRR